MNKKINPGNGSQDKNHLIRLRDFLDLPYDSLGQDRLTFLMAERRQVIASYIETGHLSLICEIASLDALTLDDWRSLVLTLSSVHDYVFPPCLRTVDGQLALIWGCDESIHADEWLQRAEDALTWAYDIHMRLSTHTL